MAIALQNDDIPAALAFATASSKLVGIALKKGMKTHQLLTAAALGRVIAEFIVILREHVSDEDEWIRIVDEFLPQLQDMQL